MFTSFTLCLFFFVSCCGYYFFYLSDWPARELYTLSLHDALPICAWEAGRDRGEDQQRHAVTNAALSDLLAQPHDHRGSGGQDRKSTRLNSSHVAISYAVFCLKKKT